MKRLLRRLSRVAAADACAAAAYQPLRPDAAMKAFSTAASASSSSLFGARRLGRGARVPEGHVPVCVGEEGGSIERFAVPVELLGQPAFKALLRRAGRSTATATRARSAYPAPWPTSAASSSASPTPAGRPPTTTTMPPFTTSHLDFLPRSAAMEGVIGNLSPGKGKSVNKQSQLPAAAF